MPESSFALNESPLQPSLIATLVLKNFKYWEPNLLRVLCIFVFRRSPSEADRGVTYLKLAAATRRRWLVLDEFAKYAFFGLTRKNPAFERSVLMYVSIKNRILTQSGQKRRVCVNAADRLSPRRKAQPTSVFPTQQGKRLPKSCLRRLCQRDSPAQASSPALHAA